MEKLKKILGSGEGSNKKRIENVTVFIIILIVTIVAINYIWSGDSAEQEELKTNDVIEVVTETTTEDDVELKLEKILSNIEGVGEVKVMLTYSETSTFIPIYNETTKGSNTTESDTSGGSRTISEEDTQKEVVFSEDSDGNKEPVMQSVISPKIEGAIITAEGAGDVDIKSNIIQAVEAATGLATHKIQVFKMEESN